MRAVIYQHEEHEGLARLARPLQENGFSLVHRFRSARHDDVDAELVVVMGGRMAVHDDASHPFLREERAVLSERLAGGKPCLGICLGAQLIAAAAGSDVFAGKNGVEVGVGPARWTEAALRDPVISGVRPKTAVVHWHGDTYKPVPEATLLASTDRYTQQAFRLGNTYAFQFHIELSVDDLGQWLELDAGALTWGGKTRDELERQRPKLQAAEPELADLMERLARHFRTRVA